MATTEKVEERVLAVQKRKAAVAQAIVNQENRLTTSCHTLGKLKEHAQRRQFPYDHLNHLHHHHNYRYHHHHHFHRHFNIHSRDNLPFQLSVESLSQMYIRLFICIAFPP